jgi:prepilin-type N-terminal cleavage/methylation domain-containing protein
MKIQNRQSGYSLAEMLTVVAIIGVLALVMVPNFMNFYESNKMKSSMRNFMSDLRSVRQLSISQGKQAILVYHPGSGTDAFAKSYDIWLGDKQFNSQNWTPQTGPNANPPRATKQLDKIAYFPSDTASTPQSFADKTLDCSSGTNCQSIPPGSLDSLYKVFFFPDGRAQLPTGATSGTITLKTDLTQVSKPQYKVFITPTGRVLACACDLVGGVCPQTCS